jgi:hypothetical protein
VIERPTNPGERESSPCGSFERALAKAMKSRTGLIAARSLARDLYFRCHLSGPPFSPTAYAHALRVRMEYADISEEGLLMDWPGPNGRIVLKDLGTCPTIMDRRRQNFTLAHELAHIVLRYEIDSRLRMSEYTLDDPAEERLCDAFAAELLMPSVRLRDDLRLNGVAPSAIVSLCDRYDVSLMSMVASVGASAGPGRLIAILWNYRGEILTASWAWPNRFRNSILVDTGKTTVERALLKGGEFQGRDQLLINGKRESWLCASQLLPKNNKKILTIGIRSDCSYRLITRDNRPRVFEHLSLVREPVKGQLAAARRRLKQQ